MRVVGGSLGGRRFNPPANIPARPTTDLAREALFNILGNMIELEGIRALDLFGGTGGVSYELVSRSAEEVTVVEQDATSVAFIKKMAAEYRIEDELKVMRNDVFRYLKGLKDERFGLIFADPPYALPKMGDLVGAMLPHLEDDGMAILEHDTRHKFDTHPNFLKAKGYGDTIFTFFSAKPKTV